MSADEIIRDQLLALLRGGNAHMPFAEAVANFPLEHINTHLPHLPYSFWHLLEHIRLTQWDILDFIRNPDYQYLPWPAGYWPAPETNADEAQWNQTIADFHADLQALESLVRDPATNLTAPIPHAPDYTVFREILLVADHNAYHIGELGILRQIVGLWPTTSASR